MSLCARYAKNGIEIQYATRKFAPESGSIGGVGVKTGAPMSQLTILKILPSSHSTATWCIMVNVSM